MDFWHSFSNSVEQNLGISGLATTLLASFFLGTFSLMLRPVRSWFYRRGQQFTSFFHARARINRADNAVVGQSLWQTKPIKRPDEYGQFFLRQNKLPILTIAHLKGGVGKTTTATNLGAYFAKERHERVLLIDFDYQGSMSSMMLTREARIPAKGAESIATKLLIGDVSMNDWTSMAQSSKHQELNKAFTIPAFYDFADAENRLMVHWLTGKIKKDIRYSLANYLHSQVAANTFDRVIIDAPPRMTVATVQALCASTHVLIPTVLDELSAEATGTFLETIETLRTDLWPHLRVIGVSGQMVTPNIAMWKQKPENEEASSLDAEDQLAISERSGMNRVKEEIRRVTFDLDRDKDDPVTRIMPPETHIAKRAPIASSAGNSVAFLDINNDLRAMYRNLGEEVRTRMRRE